MEESPGRDGGVDASGGGRTKVENDRGEEEAPVKRLGHEAEPGSRTTISRETFY